MARSIWKGSITIGLVNIPIELFNTAVESREAINRKIHNITPCCNSRVNRVDKCGKCGREVPSKEMIKGYEVSKDKVVLMSVEERNSAKFKSEHTIEIDNFSAEMINPLKVKEHYHAGPQAGAEKAYGLLVELLSISRTHATTRITMGGMERVATVWALGGKLVLTALYYDTELVPAPQVAPIQVSEKDKTLGMQLLEAMKTDKVEWDKYKDRYSEAMLKLINAKLLGQPVPVEAVAEATPAMDLENALMVSIKKKKAVA